MEWIHCRPLARTSMAAEVQQLRGRGILPRTPLRRLVAGSTINKVLWSNICSGLTINNLHQPALRGYVKTMHSQNQSNSAARMLRYADAPPHHHDYYAKGPSLVSLYVNFEVFGLGRPDSGWRAFLCWKGNLRALKGQLPFHVHPMPSKIAFVSFKGIPLTPNARTCVPLLNRCRPTATFHPSSSGRMKTYRLPS